MKSTAKKLKPLRFSVAPPATLKLHSQPSLKQSTKDSEWEEHLLVQRNVSNFVDQRLILIDSDYLRSKKVLDLGCGYGHQTQDLASHSPNKTFLGIDNDKKAIAQALLAKSESVNYKVSDINKKEKLGLFDCIITKLVLQHLPSLENYLKFCSKNLKKQGCVFIIDTYDALRRISSGLEDELKVIYRKLTEAQKDKGSNRHALKKLPNLLYKFGFVLEQEQVSVGLTDREIKKEDLAKLYQLNLSIIYHQYKVKFDLNKIKRKLQKWLKNPNSFGSISCHFLKIRKIK